ncbi:hypothetical protein EMIT019CA3_50183 [Bacillus pseudomycoides]
MKTKERMSLFVYIAVMYMLENQNRLFRKKYFYVKYGKIYRWL